MTKKTATMIESVEAEAVPPAKTAADFTADTMLGTLTTICIDELKAAPDCWAKLSEDQQDDVIKRVTSQVGDAVREAVRIIATQGRDVIVADLEQITAKDSIKAVLTLAKHDPNRHMLLDAVGKPVLIVVASSEEFMGGAIPKADPNQLPLDVDAANDSPVADNCPATAVNA